MRRALAVTAILAVVAAGWVALRRPDVIDVPPGRDVTRLIAAATPGSVIRLLPGRHDPFIVGRPVTVEAAAGSVVTGPVEVLADRVRLRGLRIVGGRNGITVRGADRVAMEGVSIRGTELHGIEIAPGSATVHGCDIGGLTSPYGQGFEIRNSNGRPRTVVEGCSISSGQEGLVSHVSRVEFLDNVVTGTTMRGISVVEMSEGLVAGNVVRDVVGVGVLCDDMSHCEIRDNVVNRVRDDGSGVLTRQGYGAVVSYHSMARLSGNRWAGLDAPEPVGVYTQATLTERFPMSIWPAGWRGALPVLPVAAASLGGAALVRLGTGRWPVRRRRSRSTRGAGGGASLVAPILLAGLVVQSFHMLEHFVQIYQIHVADAEIRSGLAGARVDTEWVHFLYNIAVLGFLVWASLVARRTPATSAGSPAAWLFAATAIQGYHLVEHVAKMLQHLTTGVDPAPGLVGDNFGLVWFHFGINLAVYAAAAAGLIGLLRTRSGTMPQAEVSPAGASLSMG